MLGAIGTHLVHKEWLMLAVASSIALAAFWRAWSGRGEVNQLLENLRPQQIALTMQLNGKVIFPSFNGHQNLTKDEVFYTNGY